MASVKKIAVICMKPLFEQWVDLRPDIVYRFEWTDLHVLQNAILIYEVRFRHTFNAEVLGNARGKVGTVSERDTKLFQIHARLGFGVHIVHAQEDDLTRRLILRPRLL